MKRWLLFSLIFVGLIGLVLVIKPARVLAAAPNTCALQNGGGSTWTKVTCPSPLARGKCWTSTNNKDWQPYDCTSIDELLAPNSAAVSGTVSTNCGTNVSPVGLGVLKPNCAGGKNAIYALLEVVINWVISVLLAVAVLAVIVSGIQYIISQGNPDGIKSAKSRLTNAVVGLALLALIFVILRFLGIG